MQRSFFFYDLETSGIDPRAGRIMQFAGMRTDENLQPLGEPVNLLVELAEDTLPSPYAVLVTGITPQATRQDGVSEREFCRILTEEIATPGTTIMGYNSVRFDDEFVRHTLWRNFYDAYAWQWQDGRSRWDLLDVVRMTRALRPEGINWPVSETGKATNRLELLSRENQIQHQHAHDALSDVEALIGVTKLVRERQPQLFEYLYNMRSKRNVAALVNLENPQPFVYASGRYPSEWNHTTVAYPVAPAENGGVLVFDLRHDVEKLLEEDGAGACGMQAGARGTRASAVGARAGGRGAKVGAEGTRASARKADSKTLAERGYFPVIKKLQYNRCPAVAPLGVLDKQDGWAKLGLTAKQVQHNLAALKKHPEVVAQAAEQLAQREFGPAADVESALYDGFLGPHDALLCQVVRNNGANELADFYPDFEDARLADLLLHYKAKNFPTALTADETAKWQAYRRERLERQLPEFLREVEAIRKEVAEGRSKSKRSADEIGYLLDELMLWMQGLGEAE